MCAEELLVGAESPRSSQEGNRKEHLQRHDSHQPDVQKRGSDQDLVVEASEDSHAQEPLIFRRLERHNRTQASDDEEGPDPREQSRRKTRDRLADRLSRLQDANAEQAAYTSKRTHRRERDRLADRLGPPQVEDAANRPHQRGRDRLADRLGYAHDSAEEDSPRSSKLPHHRLADRLHGRQGSSDNEPPYVAEEIYRKERQRLRTLSHSTASSSDEAARVRAHRDHSERDLVSTVPKGTMGLRSDSLFSRAVSAGAKPSRHGKS
jgi:hypothetical protein